MDSGGAHPADIRLGRGDLLEARRQVVHRRGDHRNSRFGDAVGDEPTLGRSDEHDLQGRKLALELEHLEDVAGPFDMDEEVLASLEHRNQRRRVEAGQEHVLAAARIGAVDARFVGVADDGPVAFIRLY